VITPVNIYQNYGTGKFVIVLDKQKIDTVNVPAITDIWTTTNLDTASLNMANSKRFQILGVVPWEYKSGSAKTSQVIAGVTYYFYEPCSVMIRWFKKLDLVVRFGKGNGTTTTFADIRDNIIYVYSMTDSQAGDFNADATSRIHFWD